MKTGWIKIVGIFSALFLMLGVLSAPGAVSLAEQGDPPLTFENGPEGTAPERPDSGEDVQNPETGIRNSGSGSNGALCNVAVLGATDFPEPLNDVKTKLEGTGQFALVDTYNTKDSTPSLVTMQLYDAVLVFSSAYPVNPALLGDNLADYVDGGGGVVSSFASNIIGSYLIQGRFNSENYWGLQPVTNFLDVQSGLGTLHDPLHPVMAGVNDFDGGSFSYRADTSSPHPNAVVLADWLDGNPLVAVREDLAARRVDLNFYPVSADVYPGSWLPNTDGARLMANALFWTGECTYQINLPLIAQSLHPVFGEDFSADPNLGSTWTIYRGTDDPAAEAWWDPAEEEFYLTTAVFEKSATVFADFTLPPDSWVVEFDYRIGGGEQFEIGDGFTFMFYKDESSFAVDPPGVGGMLGFQTGLTVPAPGYGIEFDTVWNQQLSDPPYYAHVALIDDSVDTHLDYAFCACAGSGDWHHATIWYSWGMIEVKVEGNLVLSYVIPNPDTQFTGVGFSAATGWFTNQHVIDNFWIYAP